MEEYQEKYEQLLEEKKKVELEFGLARRRFKELYVGCENQLNNEKETSRQLEIQVKELTRQIDSLKSENEGVRIAAKISEEAKQEEFGSINTKHQEELASMQHIWKEHAYDTKNRLVKEFEEERKKLLDANSKLEQKIRQMQMHIDEGGDTARGGNNDSSLVSMMGNVFTSSKKSPNTKNTETANLENSQQQVQQDIDAWKSVVEPLEQEIESLKRQLAEAQSRGRNTRESTPTAKRSDKELMLNEELKEAQKYFESEKSARTDLEMYVAVLNTQKSVLQEDSDKLKRELHNVCRLFEQEKMSHNELKQTWKLANEQFIAQQQNLFYELERTKKVLTPLQLEQLSKNIPDKSSAIKTVAEHPYQVSTNDQVDGKPNENLIDFGSGEFSQPVKPEPKNADKSVPQETPMQIPKSDKITDSLFNTFFPAAYQARQFNEMLMENTKVKEQPLILSSSSDSEDDDLVQAIRIQNLNRYGVEEGEEVIEANANAVLNSNTNPVAILEDFDNELTLKKSTSTDDILHSNPEPKSMEKSLSQGDISWSTNSVELNNSDPTTDTPVKKEDSIWNTVSGEFAHTCMMCQNYEKQLQRLQKDYMGIKEREQNLLDNIKSLQYQLNSEKETVASLEKSIENVSNDNKSQLCIYEKNQQEVDKQVLLLQNQFQEFQMNILQEMKKSLSREVTADA